MGIGDRNELILDEYGYDGDHLKSSDGLNQNNPSEDAVLDDAIFELYKKDKIQKLKRKLDASVLADLRNVKMGIGDRNELILDEYGYDGDHLKSSDGLNQNNPSEDAALDDAIFELYKKDKIQKLKRKLDASVLADLRNVKSKKIMHDKKSKPTSTRFSAMCDQKSFDITSISFDFMSKLESSSCSVLPSQCLFTYIHRLKMVYAIFL
ncbi:uncharacterized protein LOC133917942 [Phragmites australis]|uniref:uncharacterized protein LOC133917942 n=1 Tax=Phragmites australis TaxID=29695 RepID=UPI002D76FC85|nr:uncharacterized protein LOC133917942 [Phragmites australis]